MAQFVLGRFQHILAILETALDIRKDMAAVATSKEHIVSIKTIILKQVQELCELMGRMEVSEPGPIKLEYIGCLRRLGAVKSGLHSISEVFLEVDWAAFDQVLTNGYKAMGG